MIIIDCEGVHEAGTMNELDVILARRFRSDANAFWISSRKDAYPQLVVLVRGDLATLNFLASGNDAGLRVIGDRSDLDPEQLTTFILSEFPADDVFVVNTAVIAPRTAFQVAREFFQSNDLPQSVEWFQL